MPALAYAPAASLTFGRLRRATSSAWGFAFTVLVVSRAVFFAVGAIAAKHIEHAIPAANVLEPAGTLNYWAHWDGAWYSAIARDGYEHVQPALSPAFFPLYPLTIRAGMLLPGGPALWGVVISTTAALFAFYFVYRLAESFLDRRAARAAVLVFAFFPTAFFLNAVYTEALFVALTSASLWAALVRRNLLLAGVLAGFATATRHIGISLLVPIAYEAVRNRGELGWKGVAGVALVPTGLAAYAVYLWDRFGHPFEFLHAEHVGWHRGLTSPVTSADRLWNESGAGFHYLVHPELLFRTTSPAPPFALSVALNVLVLALVLALVAGGFFVLPRSLALYAALTGLGPVLLDSPTQPPLLNYTRLVLAAFPLFIVLGLALSRVRPLLLAWLAVSAVAGGFLTALFTTWRWVA